MRMDSDANGLRSVFVCLCVCMYLYSIKKDGVLYRMRERRRPMMFSYTLPTSTFSVSNVGASETPGEEPKSEREKVC